MFIAALIHSCQKVKATQMPIDTGMDKQNVVYINMMEYFLFHHASTWKNPFT